MAKVETAIFDLGFDLGDLGARHVSNPDMSRDLGRRTPRILRSRANAWQEGTFIFAGNTGFTLATLPMSPPFRLEAQGQQPECVYLHTTCGERKTIPVIGSHPIRTASMDTDREHRERRYPLRATKVPLGPFSRKKGPRRKAEIPLSIAMVPKAGFEPARVSPPPPQDGVSASSTTSACGRKNILIHGTAQNQDEDKDSLLKWNPNLYSFPGNLIPFGGRSWRTKKRRVAAACTGTQSVL